MSKVRKTLDFAARIIIAILALSFLFYNFSALPAEQVDVFFRSVINNDSVITLAVIIVLLMLVNLGIEALKWQILIKQLEIVSFSTAFFAILSGMAASVYTPNRVGEFIGRIFILKKADPYKATLLTLVGSFSQLAVTILYGTLALVIFVPKYLSEYLYGNEWIASIIVIGLVSVSVLIVILFLNISYIHRITNHFPIIKTTRLQNILQVLAECPRSLLVRIILLSASRYLVFSFQFYLCIRLVGAGFTFTQSMLIIPLIYLTLSVIPTNILTELGVRGSVSVYLFALLTKSQSLDAITALEIVSASTLIWIINIAVPSLIGVLIIFRLKFFR